MPCIAVWDPEKWRGPDECEELKQILENLDDHLKTHESAESSTKYHVSATP